MFKTSPTTPPLFWAIASGEMEITLYFDNGDVLYFAKLVEEGDREERETQRGRGWVWERDFS